MKKEDQKVSHRTDEYLEAIYKLQEDEHPVKLVRISNSLKISSPSVSEMLKRLEEKRLINVQKGSFCLTKKGEKEAKKVIRKHRLSEVFLTDVLGMGWEEAHDEACKLEHAISDKVSDQLAEKLGQPQSCPHGHPIPDKKGRLPIAKTTKLDKLKSGDSARVKCVSEEDSAMLQYLGTLGILPNIKIKIEEIAPFGGPMIIRVGKARYAIGRTIASKIEVEITKK